MAKEQDESNETPAVGPLLRKSAVLGVAALMTAGDAVKVVAGRVKNRVKELAAEVQEKAGESGDR